jgi:hypothetical protein
MSSEQGFYELTQAYIKIAALVAQIKALDWISVKERLPKMNEEVLAGFMGQFQWVAFVATMGRDGLMAPGYAIPTHWQPLPTPPHPIQASAQGMLEQTEVKHEKQAQTRMGSFG